MKNDFNLKKKINIIGNKIFTNFEQKLHDFRLNHPLQDLWILTNTGVALYHREFDNTISVQLFGTTTNSLAHIHWHVIPRYEWGPEPTRPIWVRPKEERKVGVVPDVLSELVSKQKGELEKETTR